MRTILTAALLLASCADNAHTPVTCGASWGPDQEGKTCEAACQEMPTQHARCTVDLAGEILEIGAFGVVGENGPGLCFTDENGVLALHECIGDVDPNHSGVCGETWGEPNTLDTSCSIACRERPIDTTAQECRYLRNGIPRTEVCDTFDYLGMTGCCLDERQAQTGWVTFAECLDE